jgi:hypothetical protein
MDRREPSPPTNPAATCVYITRGTHKQLITTWGLLHTAKAQIDLALDGHPFKWLDHQTIITDNQVKIQCHHLEDIMELDADPDILQDHEVRAVERFLSDKPSATQPMTRRERRKARIDAMKGPTAQPSARPAPTERPGPSNEYVPLMTVAEQLGVDAKAIRAAVRKANWTKPGGSWVFLESEIPAIRKLLRM